MTAAYMSTLRNSFRRKKRRSAVELEICPVGTEIYVTSTAFFPPAAVLYDLEGNYIIWGHC